jgi:hypothetical protein
MGFDPAPRSSISGRGRAGSRSRQHPCLVGSLLSMSHRRWEKGQVKRPDVVMCRWSGRGTAASDSRVNT